MKYNRRGKRTAEVEPGDPLFFALLETAASLTTRLEAALKAVGLSRAKMELLHQLVRSGKPLPLTTLAKGQHCAPSNMTTLVDRLEAEGVVRRVADSSDRRSVRAGLTTKGRQAVRAGMAVVARVEQEFSGSLGAEEREGFRRILESLR